MADFANSQYALAGKVVVELASDPWLFLSRRLVTHGPRSVIASNITDNWTQETADGVEIQCIDARTIDCALGRESVDAVIGINLLEHLDNIPMTLAAIYGALRPGGYCLLHGDPIWTSARGHHAMYGDMGSIFTFADDSNPFPKWGHLYMEEAEMRRELEISGLNGEAIDVALHWALHSDLITRTPRLEIIRHFRESPFESQKLLENRLESPTKADLIRIRQGRWWKPGEDYGVRGMTCLLCKSA